MGELLLAESTLPERLDSLAELWGILAFEVRM